MKSQYIQSFPVFQSTVLITICTSVPSVILVVLEFRVIHKNQIADIYLSYKRKLCFKNNIIIFTSHVNKSKMIRRKGIKFPTACKPWDSIHVTSKPITSHKYGNLGQNYTFCEAVCISYHVFVLPAQATTKAVELTNQQFLTWLADQAVICQQD